MLPSDNQLRACHPLTWVVTMRHVFPLDQWEMEKSFIHFPMTAHCSFPIRTWLLSFCLARAHLSVPSTWLRSLQWMSSTPNLKRPPHSLFLSLCWGCVMLEVNISSCPFRASQANQLRSVLSHFLHHPHSQPPEEDTVPKMWHERYQQSYHQKYHIDKAIHLFGRLSTEL